MKVFAVVEMYYDDIEQVCVYTTREQAEAAQFEINAEGPYAQLFEVELDAAPKQG